MNKKTSQFLKFLIGNFIVALLFFICSANINAQKVVDKTVATVGDGTGIPELITYSDLLWQIALQPNGQLNPPNSEELNQALQLLINQRLFALEAQRLPRAAPPQTEIDGEIKRVVEQFSTSDIFERRLRLVGFDSIKDANFQRIMEQRVAIEKYLDFRFRSFVVITAEDEAKYYREVFTPDFRRRNPGLLLPTLEERRTLINQILTEEKVARDIEEFLDDAKSRAEIIILSEV